MPRDVLPMLLAVSGVEDDRCAQPQEELWAVSCGRRAGGADARRSGGRGVE